MIRFFTSVLSSIGLLVAISGSAAADEPYITIFKGGSGPHTSAVRIYQPSQNQPPVDQADSATQVQVSVVKTITIVAPIYREHETSKQRRERAIGQRYVGFIKQYRGQRYPF